MGFDIEMFLKELHSMANNYEDLSEDVVMDEFAHICEYILYQYNYAVECGVIEK